MRKAASSKHREFSLKLTQGIKFCYLTVEDVVRHPLVQKIIEAYQ